MEAVTAVAADTEGEGKLQFVGLFTPEGHIAPNGHIVPSGHIAREAHIARR